MRPMIEFCINNMHHGTDTVVERLENDPGVDVLEVDCLGHCDLCLLQPYAMVDGEIVAADSVDELFDKIMEAIENREDPYAGFDFD